MCRCAPNGRERFWNTHIRCSVPADGSAILPVPLPRRRTRGSIGWLLKKHPDMHVLPVPMPEGFAPGHPEWADMEEVEEMEETAGQMSGPEAGSASGPAPGLEHTMRLWPHRLRGEGHFVAVLERRERPGRKNSRQNRRQRNFLQNGHAAGTGKKDWRKGLCGVFRICTGEPACAAFGIYLRFGEQLYLAPEETPVLRGLKVLRPGLHLGTVKKNRFEPSHALALTLKPEDAAHAVSLDTEGRQVKDYLNGLTFPAEGEKGWYLICADGCSLGWGKLAGGIMKNHYPKGLRKNW